MPMLATENLTKTFGGLVANNEISFAMEAGELLAVIGPNGAGKTTLFNMISGYFAPDSGRVRFDGHDITGLPLHVVAGRGLVRTFQLAQPFRALSVRENVHVGFHTRTRGGLFAAILRPRWLREQETSIRAGAQELLEIVGLGGLADARADELSYGQQRLLELARALACAPKLLLLDEPAAGLAPHETTALAGIIRRINDRGVGVLLIEHDMGLVMDIAARIVVLDFGRKIAEGTPAVVKAHPDVIDAYLGGTELADA